MFISKNSSIVISLGLFLLTFAFYIFNLPSSVYGGDSGDFLSAIAVFGVPHPSGYPLYTLLGIIFNHLPIPQTIAWKVGLISALFSSLTVLMMYLIIALLTKSRLLALITALTLAFVFPFWLFAEVSEVFALHNFFLLLLFYLGILLYQTKRIKYLYLTALILGLSFANHALTVLIIPTLLIFILPIRKKLDITWLILMRSLGLFIVGLLLYLYIPIAASHNPPINWENASTLTNFLQLVFRSSYGWSGGGGGFASVASLLSLQNYVFYWITQLPLLALIAIPFGMIAMIKMTQRTIFFATISSFLLFGPIFFLYSSYITLSNTRSGIDEKFYTSSILFLLIFLPYGIRYLTTLALKLLAKLSPLFLARQQYIILFHCIFLLIPFLLFIENKNLLNLNKISIGDKLGKDVLNSLPQNSYVWITEDDNITFNSRYIQQAYNVRKDVHILAGVDLKNTPLEGNMKLHAFPYGERSNNTILYSLQLAKNHSTFIMLRDYDELNQQGKTLLYPYGLLLKVTNKEEQKLDKNTFLTRQDALLHSFNVAKIPKSDQLSNLQLIADIPLLYANAYANTGHYLIVHYKDYDTAKPYFENALKLSLDADSAYEGLGDYYLDKGKCIKAKELYQEATNINTLNLTAHNKLYKVVTTCSKDEAEKKRLERLSTEFPSLFEEVIPFKR